ncbi:MAG TPA: hypothetical protein DCY54_00870, partial [Parachlamydiales bacterium]|nr:hypothetical protein [Parachlamydiales bacterium]
LSTINYSLKKESSTASCCHHPFVLMNDLQIFFLCKAETAGGLKNLFSWRWSLEKTGNLFLTPLRALWHGREVRMNYTLLNQLEGIHHVASFHKEGELHCSHTLPALHSSHSHPIRTALFILGLLPCLVLGTLFKTLAYAVSETTVKHHKMVKRHFTPIDLSVGSLESPIGHLTAWVRFQEALNSYSPIHPKVRHLFVFGDSKLELTAAHPLFLKTRPKKMVLVNTKIRACSESCVLNLPLIKNLRDWLFNDLDRELAKTGLFERREQRKENQTFVVQHPAASIPEALTNRPPLRKNHKPYHRIYSMALKAREEQILPPS